MNPSENTIAWSPAHMLEISLREPDDFLKIAETLTRIGIAAKNEHNTLYQSCHILHKQGRYYIVHFKELFCLDGKQEFIAETDLARRNSITLLLSDWGLLTVVSWGESGTTRASMKEIKVISHKEKADWNLCHKYTIGKIKGKVTAHA
jgi:hypothetical protein